MTPAELEALRDIRGYAAAGRVIISRHARRRMAERGANDLDVMQALASAKSCESQPRDRWRVESTDLDGNPLAVVVVIEAGLIVVTLF
ncbi:MAG: DUF4258 domain-containing protein [bacterium]